MIEADVYAVNPRRRKRRVKRNAKGRFVKASRSTNPKRRRRRRRNPVGMLAVANPRRRRVRARRRRNPIAAIANPRRRRRVRAVSRRRRSRARNPRLMGAFRLGAIKEMVIPAAIGGAGAVALDVALGYIPADSMPSFLQNPWGKLAVRVVGAVGLGFVVGKVTDSRKGRIAAVGALTVTAYNLFRDLKSQFAPTLPMADYDDGMGYWNPAPQVSAYMEPTTAMPTPDMGAYMEPSGMPGLNGWGNDGM